LHNNVSPGCISASSGRISLKICVLNPTIFQNNRNKGFCGLCVIILLLHNLAFRCFVSFYFGFLEFLTLQGNRRNTVYFKVTVHFVCCVWNSLEQVLGSECASGGFVARVFRHCVVVSRGNLMAAVLRTIHFFHEVISGCL